MTPELRQFILDHDFLVTEVERLRTALLYVGKALSDIQDACDDRGQHQLGHLVFGLKVKVMEAHNQAASPEKRD
jgi:hypothetical protein